jgi:peptide deformylase
MVKEIVTYPEVPSIEFNAPVRSFNQELFDLIQDLKDTIEANKLKGLSAFQIGSPYSVIVIKQDDGTFLELINAKVLQRKGKMKIKESTIYFPNVEVEVPRDKDIKVMYEDREANQKFLDASDELSALIQRKIDYNFGANIRHRLDKEDRDAFDSQLEFGADALDNNFCPTTFQRDKVLKVVNASLAVALLAVLSKFFISAESVAMISSYLNYALIAIFFLIIFYIFFGYYEGKKYTSCTSCQIGNIIGTSALYFIRLLVVTILKFVIF